MHGARPPSPPRELQMGLVQGLEEVRRSMR
jgi:hypothetical protein